MPQQRQAVRAGKRDVELADRQIDLAKIERSVAIGTILARGFVIAMWIAAAAIPTWALQGVIEPLAGKETVVNANIVISVTVALSVAINIAQAIKGSSRKAEVERLRERISDLEGKLLE